MGHPRLVWASLTVAGLLGCQTDTDPLAPTLPQVRTAPYLLATSASIAVETLEASSNIELGRGISDAGAVPVTVSLDPASGQVHPAVWSNGVLSPLPGGFGNGQAITPSGAVLAQTSEGITIWRDGGTTIVGSGQGFNLNDLASIVVGQAEAPARWDGTELSLLQGPGGAVHGWFGLSVNNAGVAVGVGVITGVESKALRWDGTSASLLPELGDEFGAHGALQINNAGTIVGYSTGTVDGILGRHPAVWENGTVRALPTLSAAQPFGNAQDLNEAGDIVGFSRIETGEDHAVLWTASGELIDLGAELPGLNTYARGVNASGEVSGVAYRPGSETPIFVKWRLQAPTRYSFAGFFAPVENPPVLNVFKAGRSLRLQFSLGGDYGLDVLEGGYPEARTVACDPAAPLNPVRETVNAKASALVFDQASGQYSYTWRTQRDWAGTCSELVFRFDDGQERSIRFQLLR
jgi:probable HAF family extracellular repeat protein